MVRFILSCLLVGLGMNQASGQSWSVASPDQEINVTVSQDGGLLTYTVTKDGMIWVNPSSIRLDLAEIPTDYELHSAETTSHESTIKPVVHEKFASIIDKYNLLDIRFENGIGLEVRAYDRGVAWRWKADADGSVTVLNEEVNYGFNADDHVYYASEEGFYSHNERLFPNYPLEKLTMDSLASLPALIEQDGHYLHISESDLYDYPGLWLQGTHSGVLTGTFPKYPLQELQVRDRDVMVTQTANYLVKTNGRRTFPWRTIIMEDHAAGLLTNTLIYQLNRPAEGDFSWVKPGKVQWDWWNDMNVYGVDFASGVNTDTYKYYIDFASENNIPYIILDEGWSPTTDVTVSVPEVNVPELARYGKEKGVGLILWVLWNSLDKDLDKALNQYTNWGIKGIKVDFMQRNDAQMVNYYERIARATAEHHLLLDFHGCYKPTGFRHQFPQALTREGVRGNEWSKWDNSKQTGPDHNLMLPFTRMVCGPMDYTPGAMLNAQRRDWSPSFSRPMSLGTRCHQLAMYVVFESPIQMLCDVPDNYKKEPESFAFLKNVPTTWEDTRVLEAAVGKYIVDARQAANGDWYLGAMTDWTERQFEITLDFLDAGEYSLEYWEDGINANRMAQDYKTGQRSVRKGDRINLKLARGGGYVALIHKK
ncbi:MAG: glycoside hydrolase family 97 protein [Saprospiraceae bacterium]|nr:glycoside hydrolase family 97 protein [Saprospiraceae bacterium]